MIPPRPRALSQWEEGPATPPRPRAFCQWEEDPGNATKGPAHGISSIALVFNCGLSQRKRSSICTRIAAPGQHRAVRVAQDDLAAPEERPLLAGDPFDLVTHRA